MPDDVGKEIEDMLDDLGDTLDLKSDPPEDPEKKQEVEASVETEEEETVETSEVAEVVEGEEKEVEKPELTAEQVEAKADEIEEVEVKVETEVEVEVEVSLEDQIKDLKEREEKLLERIEAVTVPAQKPVTEPPPEEVLPEVVKGVLEGLDIDEVVSKPEVFEKVMTEVQRRTQIATTESVLRAIPQLIIKQVQQQNMLRDAATEFYTAHEDLAHVKQTVGAVANEVQAENPEWSMAKIFEETAPRTRKLLGMKEQATNVRRIRNPALPKKVKSSQKPSAPDLSGLEKDIADTIL